MSEVEINLDDVDAWYEQLEAKGTKIDNQKDQLLKDINQASNQESLDNILQGDEMLDQMFSKQDFNELSVVG